jgi:hypothetical protein
MSNRSITRGHSMTAWCGVPSVRLAGLGPARLRATRSFAHLRALEFRAADLPRCRTDPDPNDLQYTCCDRGPVSLQLNSTADIRTQPSVSRR